MAVTERPLRPPEVAPVASSRANAFVRAVKVVCHRELIRFRADRTRMVSSLGQPILYLFVLGTGLSGGPASSLGGSGIDYQTFLFPGVLAMSVLFTAMFSAMSIVWDREFGFLREMLVAPVPRSAIVIGKALGGSIVATFQGAVILAMGGLASVPYDPLMMLLLLGQLFLLAFTISGFGLVIAARITEIQAFMGVMNLVVMPLFFLSGALYPLGNLPEWLQVVARFNPLSYAVSAMRATVFAQLDLPAGFQSAIGADITWIGWQVPTGLEVLSVAVLGAALIGAAIAEFRRTE